MPREVKLRTLSLGAGVQSSTVLLMAEAGEIEDRIDAAIFGDTGYEPKAVYEWLEYLKSQVKSIPILTVTNGNIRQALVAPATARQRYAVVPFYLLHADGKKGMGRRQCTHEYKLKPIGWKQRELLGVGRRTRIAAGTVENFIGISLDEAHRMKPSKVKWCIHRWPLIEKRMTRHDCLRWLQAHGHPEPPKSACICCPFRNDARWIDLREKSPEEWQEAVWLDEMIRNGGTQASKGMRATQYVHDSRIPLSEVELHENNQPDLFGMECEGLCGV